MGNIAIIIARGGSKRIPRKNIVPVGGLPLLSWSVAAALESGVCERVLVSTNDPEIAKVAEEAGAETPFLRDKAADDSSNASEACLAALSQAESHWKATYDNTILLMPTCPLRTGKEIALQYEIFKHSNCDFLLSCAGFGPTKPWWAFTMDEGKRASFLHPEALKTRSQLLAKLFAPSGATWIASTSALRKSGTFYGLGHQFHEIPWISALDIDEPSDVEFIDLLLAGSKRA